MSETVKFGDVVTIQGVLSEEFRSLIGRIGTVLRTLPAGRYLVQVGGDSEGVIVATAVEKVDSAECPTSHSLAASERALYAAENHLWRDDVKDQSDFTTGETVRIVRPRDNDGRRSVGKVGIVDNIMYLNGRPDTFFVRVGEETYRAAWVEEAPTDAPPSELDRRRILGAELARRILGADADLDDLLRLAEWLLNEQTERVTFNPGGVVFTPNDGRIVAEPQEPPRPTADLRIEDTDGDAVNFRCVTGRPDTVAFIVSAPAGTYVTADDADRIIALLQDAKAARNT